MHARIAIAALLSLAAAGCATAGKLNQQAEVEGARLEYVDRQLGRQTDAMERRGYALVGQPRFGALQRGVYEEFDFELEPGNYEIRGVCDQNCSQLALHVYDRLGQPVPQTGRADDSPIAFVRAHGEGTVRVRARMMSCQWESCALGLAVYKVGDSAS